MQRVLLAGEYDHILDPKGRITVPARYRDYFAHGAVLVRFPDNEPCVRMYHEDAWNEFDAKYIEPLNVFQSEKDSWKARIIYDSLYPVEPDRQGRVLIPNSLIGGLGLSGKVKIVGNRTHLEIWNPDTYAKLKAEWRRADA